MSDIVTATVWIPVEAWSIPAHFVRPAGAGPRPARRLLHRFAPCR